MRNPFASLAFVTLAVLVVAGCGAGDPPSRSGADVEPVTLRATSYEPGGAIGSVTLAEFARRASARSNGAIKIKVGPDPDSSRPDTSAEKIAEIRKGYYDLGIVAARSFDKLGVPAFQALQAPFLVTSNELGERILEDGIADEMLDTLDRLSLEGLALTYADRRFPLGYGAPLVSIDDYRGKSVAARPSAATYATLRALGAVPTPVNGGDLAAAAEAGTVVGSEGVLARTAPSRRGRSPQTRRGTSRRMSSSSTAPSSKGSRERSRRFCDRRPRRRKRGPPASTRMMPRRWRDTAPTETAPSWLQRTSN